MTVLKAEKVCRGEVTFGWCNLGSEVGNGRLFRIGTRSYMLGCYVALGKRDWSSSCRCRSEDESAEDRDRLRSQFEKGALPGNSRAVFWHFRA